MMDKELKGRDNKKRSFRGKKEREASEFNQYIVDIARVTRVMAGGKRMRFRVCLLIGDKKGRVGMGLAKGKDVQMAVQKAYRKAEHSLIKVAIVNNTIPHEVLIKLGAAKLLIKPAPEGTGVIAGGACRMVFELAGISNIVSKILGTNNKVNNVKATLAALSLLKTRKDGKAKEEKTENKDDQADKVEANDKKEKSRTPKKKVVASKE